MGLWRSLRDAVRPPSPHERLMRELGKQQLRFKDAESALEYACKFLDTKPETGKILPGIVDDISERGSLGVLATVRVACPDSPATCEAVWGGDGIADYAASRGALNAILLGDVVPFSGGVRALVVVGVLEPVWSPKGWLIKRQFSPS